ncbi:molybdopterin-binding protein [Clostridium formicaceticum]|nr:molybdopterin-binding protein [Clostridium formicaceticum]AOY78344.1 molybdopterin-binding protein [Clostridium formicaceticum]
MKKIPVQDAIGSILCHDITQIIPGVIKDRAFKKGHIISEEDIPMLLSLGKDHIYVWEKREGLLHEDEAAQRLRKLATGEGLIFSEVKEGKINFIAEGDGLLKINRALLYKLNLIEEIILATLHNNHPVKKGQKVGGVRIIPLLIEEEKIKKAEELIGKEKIMKVAPFIPIKVGIITTGNEVYYGRIKDAFGPVIRKKVEAYDCEVLGQMIVPDDPEKIRSGIERWIDEGAEMVICTGGMSVDPDDVTPTAIKKAGAAIVTYGVPVLPGAMFLLAYKGNIPVLGLPACAMYSKITVFDLMLPRILIKDKITYEDIVAYGHGGFCMECEECRFPDCTFGKGV